MGTWQKQQTFQLFPPWPIQKKPIKLRWQTVARAEWHEVLLLETQLLNGLGGFTFIFMRKTLCKSSLFFGGENFSASRCLMVFHTAFGSENLAWIFFGGCFSFLSVFPPTKKTCGKNLSPTAPRFSLCTRLPRSTRSLDHTLQNPKRHSTVLSTTKDGMMRGMHF